MYFKSDHLNDAHYHKYHQHHLQIPCQSVPLCPWLQDDTKQSCAFLKFEWRPIFSGARLFSVLLVLVDIQWYKIVLHAPGPGRYRSMTFFSSFPQSVSGFVIAASKALRRASFAEALATWRNISITGLDDWCHQKKKHIILESHLLVQIAINFKLRTFLKNSSKFQLRNIHFQQQQK